MKTIKNIFDNLNYYICILKESHNKREILKYFPYRLIGKKYLFKKNVIVEADGLIMDCGKFMENCLVSCSIFEEEVKIELDKIRGGEFIDIGSHIGKWSIYVAKRLGNKGRVISIEPTEYSFILQKKNIGLNSVNNIKQYNNIISDKKEKVSFYESKENPATNSLNPMFSPHNVIVKESIKLDNLIDNKKDIKLIKIDVEGSELKVIMGAKKIIELNKPKIIFESNDNNHLKEIEDYLIGIGYISIIMKEGTNNYLATYKN